MQDAPEGHVNPKRGEGPKKTGKPLMDSINVIRTEMCWRRPNLMQHKKCLKFLGIHCKEASTGHGICSEFREKVTDECMEDPDDEHLEQEDPEKLELHLLKCQISEDLGAPPHDHDDDGDGVPNSEDKFPQDPTEWEDHDGDGLGNNADPDDDNDGTVDSEDGFPLDAKEQKDSDGDGTGDNADPDDDNDEVPDAEDAFPHDPTEQYDLDGDGIGDNTDQDIDGDGVPNGEDMDPRDPNVGRKVENLEPKDGEEEIIEDDSAPGPAPGPAGTDSDGDGVPDSEDAFPQDPNESADSDGDGIGNNKDAFPHDPNETTDTDGDGYGDKSDAFPRDPTEWVDTDGDGVGDNSDHYPLDPRCHSDPCILEDGSLAPAAVMAPAPGPAPIVQANARGGVETKHIGGSNLQPIVNPWELNKKERPLPEQGYNEWSRGSIADHEDGKTFNGDWGNEFHHAYPSGYDEAEALRRACEKNPRNRWCQHQKVDDYSNWDFPFLGGN